MATSPSADEIMALADHTASLAASDDEIAEASKARPWQL